MPQSPDPDSERYDAARDFFGLPKEPLPEIADAAAQVATPDPVQQATANGTPPTAPAVDARAFFGLTGHNPAWQSVNHLI